MNYHLVKEPDLPPFMEMSFEDAELYFHWFRNQIPTRLDILERAVRSDNYSEFQTWQANKSETSLLLLGKWFADKVEAQPIDVKLREKWGEPLNKLGIEYERNWVPSERTRSLIFDLGIYLGEVFLENGQGLKWGIYREEPKSIDFSQPVIFGFKSLSKDSTIYCNPRHLMRVLASQFIQKTKPPARLFEIYQFWARSNV